MKYKITIEKIVSSPKHDVRDMYRVSPGPTFAKEIEVTVDEKGFEAVKKTLAEVTK